MKAWIGPAALLLSAVTLAAAGGAGLRQGPPPPFDHPQHAKLFVSCATCHAGATEAGGALMPRAESCASCHDGRVETRVQWRPRPGLRSSNVRFDHHRHDELRRARRDTSETCGDCHAERSAPWMRVRGPSAPQCLSCHTPGRTEHLAAPDTACASCHLPLSRAIDVSKEQVARFPAPAAHAAASFMLTGGHGAQSRPTAPGSRVAQSCATCHARDFCAACHVNAPEVPTIQALDSDARSLALAHEVKAPATHAAKDFEFRHGAQAGRTGASCATCHTQESCTTCHRAGAPRPALALFPAGPGRGIGARTTRTPPSSHVPGWEARHAPFAAASMKNCVSCHTRDSCLSCHRPDAARRGSYHPASYLTRHPADAYSRASSCTDCHNVGEFCQSCHAQGGLSARRTLLGAGGYHDGKRQFLVGHARAARQALESCVSCHVERDCLTCHSVIRGRGFSPHGPGFDSERMLRKNPQLCIACHGTAIPRR
ncbi:MAG TPA: cytochrome c3 family protein [Gemmatimonadales bacterium]|jgi:hypothetical protein|nr:cytochrome c3 family protein [Gemmatimonadales bacterium]